VRNSLSGGATVAISNKVLFFSKTQIESVFFFLNSSTLLCVGAGWRTATENSPGIEPQTLIQRRINF
jgi:hypothetical protein